MRAGASIFPSYLQMRRSIMLGAGLVLLVGATTTATANTAQPLLLEVEINGRSTGLIVAFVERSQGALWASADELGQLRLQVDAIATPDTSYPLSAIPGLTYRYDVARQTIALRIAPDRLVARPIDASARADPEVVADAPPETGGLVSYSLFAAAGQRGRRFSYSGASAALDARVFGRWGEVRQTGIVAHDGFGSHALRLDTTWTRALPARMLAFNIGDAITGATPWSRPIRFAGIQAQRDFGLRPDLVTLPLPSVAGTAAVPSSLDLYINGAHSYSGLVPEGRFQIDNLPAVTGNGDARVVLRDAQGRTVETNTPFFVSSRLLRDGLSEYSIEAGVPRRGYGVRSFDYPGDPFVSASARIGISGVTIETHGEFDRRLALVGGGLALPVGRLGVVSAAMAGSASRGRAGALVYASMDAGTGSMRFSVETRRTLGDYSDLARLSASDELVANPAPLSAERRESYAIAVRTPRASDRATRSLPVPIVSGSMSVSYARETRSDGDTRRSASLLYGRAFAGKMSMNVSAFKAFERRGGQGVFAGLSMAIGSRASASLGVAVDRRQTALTAEASRSLAPSAGSIGWRVALSRGGGGTTGGGLDWNAGAAIVHTQLARNGGAMSATLGVDGAVVFDRSLFFSPRIDGSYAIVDAGAADVPVMYENLSVGRTGANGLLLVPNTRPFERNMVGIDTTGLPLDAVAPRATMAFRPVARGGVRVAFGVSNSGDKALLHVVDTAGRDIAVGTYARVNGGEPQVVGFDGLLLAIGLKERNDVELGEGTSGCTIGFSFNAVAGRLTTLGPLACRTAASYALASNGEGR